MQSVRHQVLYPSHGLESSSLSARWFGIGFQAPIPQSDLRFHFAAMSLMPCSFAFQPNHALVRCIAEQTLICVYLWLTEVNVWERSLSLGPAQPRLHTRICLRAPMPCWRVPVAACSVQSFCLVVPTVPFHSPSPSSPRSPLSRIDIHVISVKLEKAWDERRPRGNETQSQWI